MASTKFTRTLATTKILISEYESREFLYNVPHEDYKNRNKRLEAYKDISCMISSASSERCTHIDVKKKLNGLRSQYLAEKLKIAKSVKSGADADAMYTPTVYWFPLLKFLHASTTADKSESNLKLQTSTTADKPEGTLELRASPSADKLGGNKMSVNDGIDGSIQTEVNTSITTLNSTANKQQKGQSKRVKSNNLDSLLQEATSTMSKMAKLATEPKVVQSEDDEDIFGKFMSSELKNIRKATHDRFVRQTKRKIQAILMAAWDTIDPLVTISPSDHPRSHCGHSSRSTSPLNEECSQPRTIITNEIVDQTSSYSRTSNHWISPAVDCSTSNSSKSCLWTCPDNVEHFQYDTNEDAGSTDLVHEAMRFAQIYWAD